MNRHSIFFASLPILAVAGCAPPFNYDAATREQREAYLESASDGIYKGLEKTLPRGGPAQIYAYMGERSYDVDTRTIDIGVDVRSGGENMSSSSTDKEMMVKTMCSKGYVGTELESNNITFYIHFDLPGGGTALAFRINKDRCAEFRTQQKA